MSDKKKKKKCQLQKLTSTHTSHGTKRIDVRRSTPESPRGRGFHRRASFEAFLSSADGRSKGACEAAAQRLNAYQKQYGDLLSAQSAASATGLIDFAKEVYEACLVLQLDTAPGPSTLSMEKVMSELRAKREASDSVTSRVANHAQQNLEGDDDV